MSIQSHLMDAEEVLDYCTTDYWAWVCTDRRVLRYRKGSGRAEQLHDLSFDEIAAISFVNTGRNDTLGGYGAFAVVAGLGASVVSIELIVLTFLLGVLGAYLIYRWLHSERSYFELRGSGLIQQESDDWRIHENAGSDPGEVREFVRTVRSRL